MGVYYTYPLGPRKTGTIIEVILKVAANVRLMDNISFHNYRNGGPYEYLGGLASSSPYRITIPRETSWQLVIDFRGFNGYSNASNFNVNIHDDEADLLRSTSSATPEVADSKAKVNKDYDVFISHASEDKDKIARPLNEELKKFGIKTWFDESKIHLGDSLSGSIDHGLANCAFGIVILSKTFLKKNWTKAELQAMLNRKINGRQIIIPIWHDISVDEISEFSSMLFDTLSCSTENNTLLEIAAQIAQEIFRRSERSLS